MASSTGLLTTAGSSIFNIVKPEYLVVLIVDLVCTSMLSRGPPPSPIFLKCTSTIKVIPSISINFSEIKR